MAKRRNGSGPRCAAAVGLAIGVLGGPGAGSAQAATIYACYSDTTDALSYLPSGHTCATGSTQVSWSQIGPQGPQGAKGVNWRGAWSATLAYAVGDAVAYGGSSWIARVANSNSAPASGNTNWLTLAARGVVGPQGAHGAQGSVGPQGARGAQGLTGAQGAAGSQGVPGSPGPQGVAGAQGAAGSPGPQGAQGASGQQPYGYDVSHNVSEHISGGAIRFASIVPTSNSAGNNLTHSFMVTATVAARVKSGEQLRCEIANISSLSNLFSVRPASTSVAEFGVAKSPGQYIRQFVPMTINGIEQGGPTRPIILQCDGKGSLVRETLSAVRIATPPAAPAAARPRHRFTRALRRGRL